MDFGGFTPFPEKELGGLANYDDQTIIPMGLAVVCRNMRFRRRSVITRDGFLHTMSYTVDESDPDVPPFDFTGIEALDVLVNNPQQVVLALSNRPALLRETPTGSGTLSPITTAFPLPSGVSMQTAKAYNRIYMAFSDLVDVLSPPEVLDGPTGVLGPISQSPIGAIWTPGRYYLAGDVVRTSQNANRWFRCIVQGQAGNTEPTWPTLDGYLADGAAPTANIISVGWVAAIPRRQPALNSATVDSTFGFVAGGSVTVAGNSNPAFNGTHTIYSVGSSGITWLSVSTLSGTGGTATQSSGLAAISIPATVTDPNGDSQWVEWTPGFPQYLPQPEAPAQILSVKGEAGAPSGTIAIHKDVYVCIAYTNANGESAWTRPIVFTDTVVNDVLEVFFQEQNSVPGPTVPPTFGAANYGGPRMPNWLISSLNLSDPELAWPVLKCINVYVAAVDTGDDPPQGYYQYATGHQANEPVVVTSIPNSGTVYVPRLNPTAALSTIPYVGEGGTRYFTVGRIDLNESLVPIDSGSALLVNFLSSVTQPAKANIQFIQRSSNIVTCTVDSLNGFTQGAGVIIQGVIDVTFNGTFQLIGAVPNQFGGATLLWAQTADAAASTGGTATNSTATDAFIAPQIAIGSIARATNVVTAVLASLQGIVDGAEINVTEVTDVSFNTVPGSHFTITSVVASDGGGGTVTWAQTAGNATSSGGFVSPTGVATGNNAAQPVAFIVRNDFPAVAGKVLAAVFDPSGQPTEPPPGYGIGATVSVDGMTDSSLDGTFTLTDSFTNPGKGGGWYAGWAQAGADQKLHDPAGTVTLESGTPFSQSRAVITAIARASGVVTATLTTIAGFVLGGQAAVDGVAKDSFDGIFTITSINVGSKQLTWSQNDINDSSSGGVVKQTAGGTEQPAPVAILPPGGDFIAQEFVALTVEDGSKQGPFFSIPTQSPDTPFTTDIISIGAINGTVTALLSDGSGIKSGNTIQIRGTTNGEFDGTFLLAQVSGNVAVWAGNGGSTGDAGGTLTLIPTLPMAELGQNNQQLISSMSRTASGFVSAQFDDVTLVAPGMRLQIVGGTDASFNEQVQILSVSQNQLPGSTTPLAGTVTWQSITMSPATESDGYAVGLQGIIYDALDGDLADGTDVTAQLSSLGAPSCVDIFFSETLNMMVYTLGSDSSHFFSNPGDPGNIANPGGILGVAESNGQKTVGLREMVSGEIISLKQKSGYEITVGTDTPSQWGVSRRWLGHGPCGPRAMDAADDFLIYFDEDSGPYRYHEGVSSPIGQELEGTWARLNKDASEQVCVCIDTVRREVHFALPLDNSDVPNFDFVLNYFNGWEDPLMLTYTGELVPNPRGRRWAENDGAPNGGNFRLIKVLTRTLVDAPDIRVKKRQLVSCLSGVAIPLGATSYIDMAVPDQRTDELADNAQAIDWQYQPAFTQSPTCDNLQWDAFKGAYLGGALIAVQALTAADDAPTKDVVIDVSNGEVVTGSKAHGSLTSPLYGVNFSGRKNGVAQKGWWGNILKLVRYGQKKTSGNPL